MRVLVIYLFVFASCNSADKQNLNEETITVQQYDQKRSDSLLRESDIFDSLMKEKKDSMAKEEMLLPPTAYELSTMAKVRNQNSGVQFLSKYFTYGSTDSQLRKVQGFPDDKIKTEDYTEVWLYGNCEVTVYNGKVTSVKRREDCLNYVDLTVCHRFNDEKTLNIIKEAIEIQSRSINY